MNMAIILLCKKLYKVLAGNKTVEEKFRAIKSLVKHIPEESRAECLMLAATILEETQPDLAELIENLSLEYEEGDKDDKFGTEAPQS